MRLSKGNNRAGGYNSRPVGAFPVAGRPMGAVPAWAERSQQYQPAYQQPEPEQRIITRRDVELLMQEEEELRAPSPIPVVTAECVVTPPKRRRGRQSRRRRAQPSFGRFRSQQSVRNNPPPPAPPPPVAGRPLTPFHHDYVPPPPPPPQTERPSTPFHHDYVPSETTSFENDPCWDTNTLFAFGSGYLAEGDTPPPMSSNTSRSASLPNCWNPFSIDEDNEVGDFGDDFMGIASCNDLFGLPLETTEDCGPSVRLVREMFPEVDERRVRSLVLLGKSLRTIVSIFAEESRGREENRLLPRDLPEEAPRRRASDEDSPRRVGNPPRSESPIETPTATASLAHHAMQRRHAQEREERSHHAPPSTPDWRGNEDSSYEEEEEVNEAPQRPTFPLNPRQPEPEDDGCAMLSNRHRSGPFRERGEPPMRRISHLSDDDEDGNVPAEMTPPRRPGGNGVIRCFPPGVDGLPQLYVDGAVAPPPLLDPEASFRVRHIKEAFPQIDPLRTSQMLKDKSLRTVMNVLAEETFDLLATT